MKSKLKRLLVKNLINIPGWRTNRKIVVIESDDWGMVRMASKKSYNWFLDNGYAVDKCPYNRNDSIESNEDLELLFEVLNSVEDRHGNAALMTLNNIVANPDFEKIRESKFSKYHFEPFTETLKRYPNRGRVYALYLEGKENNLIDIQFHGREHLNVNRWMSELNKENKIFLDAFRHNMFTVHKSGSASGRREHLDAFGLGYKKEWVSLSEVILSGLDVFKAMWNQSPSSFIAPCYIWNKDCENILANAGVDYLQGTHVQRVPHSGVKPGIKKKYHYLGQSNSIGQTYLVRNVHFEPTEKGRNGSVNRTLNEIKTAFNYKKPAIISSHRVNYMGSIRSENRDGNLKLLYTLLKCIVKKYPDVEFMSSSQLGKLIKNKS